MATKRRDTCYTIQTYLYEDKFRRMGDADGKRIDNFQYLAEDFQRTSNQEWEPADAMWRVGEVDDGYVGRRKERRYWFGS